MHSIDAEVDVIECNSFKIFQKLPFINLFFSAFSLLWFFSKFVIDNNKNLEFGIP